MRLVISGLVASSVLLAGDQISATKRLEDATVVLSEIMAAPDRGIPRDVMQSAQCVVLVPGLKKGTIIAGDKYGKGFLICRQNGAWSAPAAIRMEGGKPGFQVGGSETDVVLLVMNQGGENKILSSQFTLEGESEVTAGPVGRTSSAETNATPEVLSWSRSRGAFAGISLAGATLRQDLDANQELYGKRLDDRDIVKDNVAPTAAAHNLLALLNRNSTRVSARE